MTTKGHCPHGEFELEKGCPKCIAARRQKEDQDYHELQKLAADHLCGKCGGVVGVAWDGQKYVLRCGNDKTHTGLTRHDKEYEKRLMEVRMDSKSLMTMPENKMLERVGMAKFPQDLTPDQKRLLAQVAITYGFDPLMGEVTIYQGKPWVSIDGRYRKAQETGELDGVETRPATKQERDDWQIPDGDYFFRAEVKRKSAASPFVGWGRVRLSETVGSEHLPTVKNPQRMAEKRAEAQGLRKGFHIPLPSIEDIGTPEADAEIHVTVEPLKKQVQGEVKDETPAAPVPASYQDRLAIVTAAKKMGIDKQVVIDHMKAAYGKDKTADLDSEQAKAVVEAIEGGKLQAPVELF